MSLSPFWVDLHLHTVLSPCGELEMGAPEIVEAYRKADIALCAVTDHNASDNAEAVAEAAGGSPAVLAGMEVQTAEDIHIVVIFPGLVEAGDFQKWLWKKMPPIANCPEIFGDQLIIDKNNVITGEQEILLVQGAGYSADETAEEARSRGGLVILAHLDRPSFSYEAVLGPVPDDFPCHALELSSAVSHSEFSGWRERYPDRVFIRSSDSHRLSTISRDRCTAMMLESPCFREVELALSGLEGRSVVCPWGGGYRWRRSSSA
ncbi:PHP domain-containing protein [Aminivibrio sp.]|uniref:PHP domain-containing protein n=1 Tax=Aminivibrio sp. TaxID=1872489 RepID=UPI001A488861|nr:PHP domain-containing protein [Aminivibrio sp.]MBL3538250.1 PHP domain-containing protein [Aminivibrio sp.]